MSDAPVVTAPVSAPTPSSDAPAAEVKAVGGPSSFEEFFDVKVNGKVQKMSRQEVIDHASMSTAAHEKFREANQTKKNVDRILQQAKTNPIEALMDPALGLTKDQIREAFENWYSKEYIEPETLSPEQRKMKEYEHKIKSFEEQEKLAQMKAEKEKLEQLTNQQKEILQNQIIEALESSGLPKTKFFASRMAFYMRQNAMNGWEAPLSMIVNQVKSERQAIMSDLNENSSAEQLIAMLGEKVINKIRQHDLAQLRSKRNLPSPEIKSSNTTQTKEHKRTSSWAEVNKRLRDIKTGKMTF